MVTIKQNYDNGFTNYVQGNGNQQSKKDVLLYTNKTLEKNDLDSFILSESNLPDKIAMETFIKETESLIVEKLATNQNIFEMIENNKIDFEEAPSIKSLDEDSLPDIDIETNNEAKINSVKTNFLLALEAKIAEKKAANQTV